MESLRRFVKPIIERLGLFFAKAGLPAHFWTTLSLAFSAFSALFYSRLISDGVLGGVMLLISGLLDVVDGSVARVRGSVSALGAFLDSTFDRIGEVLVFFGIIFSDTGDKGVILLALSFSLLVSYTRARGESLSVNIAGIGIGERAERILALALFSLLGYTYYGVITVLILALISFLQRMVFITRELQRRG